MPNPTPTLPPDLQQLLDAALAGSADALAALFAAIRPALLLRARLQLPERLRTKVDESDVAQDALLAAHEHFTAFRGTTPAEFLAWLRTIQRNAVGRAVERFTADARCVGREQPLPEAPLPGGENTPSRNAMFNEAAEARERALQGLPEEMRLVIRLRTLEVLPYAEVARRMGRTEAAVRQLHCRALKAWDRAAGPPGPTDLVGTDG
jgi:RNA polymerase sigma-70 factor (ECF subfamily)